MTLRASAGQIWLTTLTLLSAGVAPGCFGGSSELELRKGNAPQIRASDRAEEAYASAPGDPSTSRATYLAAIQGQVPAGYQIETTAVGFQAEIKVQGLRTEFRTEGVEIVPRAGGWTFHPALSRWGCDGELHEAGPARLLVEGNLATYRRENLDEWYLNGPRGLEQGFTLAAPPACRDRGGGGVVIELSGGLEATVSKQATEAVLFDVAGQEVLRYSDLFVVDATGKELPAQLVAGVGTLSVRFQDHDATYPITVDPLMWVQQSELTANDGIKNDSFGSSVALSGDTAIVGATGTASQKGSAYIFVRAGAATWSQESELTAKDGAANDKFGSSVALSGNTAIVGLSGDPETKGAAYVFVRSGTSWSQQRKLLGNDAKGNAGFHYSVGLSGDTAIVGAPWRPTDQGTAFVFVRSGTAWSNQIELTASDGTASDLFGVSVAISGDTAIVGAGGKELGKGAAYVFVRSGALWSQQSKLTAIDGEASDFFGFSVAMIGDTAVVGAPGKASNTGAAYVFARTGSSWLLQSKLKASYSVSDSFGSTVAVSEDAVVVGRFENSPSKGAAYVFVRSGASWSQQSELTASGGVANDFFGSTVAASGTTAIVGASNGASTKGAAYVFAFGMANGSTCPGAGACVSGFCVDGVCCSVNTCSASDECHSAGVCQAGTGLCSNPVKSEDTPCASGTCQSGKCAPEKTVDISCRSGALYSAGGSPTAWLSVLTLLAVARTRRRKVGAKLRSS